MKNLVQKTSRFVLTMAILASQPAFAGPLTPANPLEGLKAGDHVVIGYRLSGFDPANLKTPASKRLAMNLVTAETASLKQQSILSQHYLNLASAEAERLSSSNPLLKSRAKKAAEKVGTLVRDLTKISIQLERMSHFKSAIEGGKLSPMDLERVRLHEFKTLRSVNNPAAVKAMAASAIQKESSVLGARLTKIDKFTAGDLAKVLSVQKFSRMKIGAGALVAGGVVVFVMYSNYEITRTESQLTEITE